MSKVCLGKALAPILVFGPLVQVPLAFFLKSPHLTPKSSLRKSLIDSVRLLSAHLGGVIYDEANVRVLTDHGGGKRRAGKRRAVRRVVSDVQSGNI
jgi:hypothetical protein